MEVLKKNESSLIEYNNIPLYNNLEYLSLSLIRKRDEDEPYMEKYKYSLMFSENQYKNINTLKIKIQKEWFFIIDDIFFKSEKNSAIKTFQNLKELHINEKLFKKIESNLNKEKLIKLNIVYDFRDKLYIFEDLKESIGAILQEYSSLTNLNISFIYIYNNSYTFEELIQDMSYLLFYLDLFQNLKNFSFDFWGSENIKCSIKNIPNKNSKYTIKIENISFYLFSSYFDKIEEIELLSNYNRFKSSLCIEENKDNNIISSITKIRIINYDYEEYLNIPIKSYDSLNYLHLETNNKFKFSNNFPLFSNHNSIKFDNLEYLAIHCKKIQNIIQNLIENFDNTPNLKFLSIINENIWNINYYNEIINKCILLRKLHTLIISHEKVLNSIVVDVNKYYLKYPILKKTNIRFCFLSKS